MTEQNIIQRLKSMRRKLNYEAATLKDAIRPNKFVRTEVGSLQVSYDKMLTVASLIAESLSRLEK